MKRYCDKCKTIHDSEEICPKIKIQLEKHPEWVSEFTTVLSSTEHILKLCNH